MKNAYEVLRQRIWQVFFFCAMILNGCIRTD
jgi:hypothetical protein